MNRLTLPKDIRDHPLGEDTGLVISCKPGRRNMSDHHHLNSGINPGFDTNGAYQAGTVIGTKLYELGFNLDFAPVADVASVPDGIMADRSYGVIRRLIILRHQQHITASLQRQDSRLVRCMVLGNSRHVQGVFVIHNACVPIGYTNTPVEDFLENYSALYERLINGEVFNGSYRALLKQIAFTANLPDIKFS